MTKKQIYRVCRLCLQSSKVTQKYVEVLRLTGYSSTWRVSMGGLYKKEYHKKFLIPIHDLTIEWNMPDRDIIGIEFLDNIWGKVPYKGWVYVLTELSKLL